MRLGAAAGYFLPPASRSSAAPAGAAAAAAPAPVAGEGGDARTLSDPRTLSERRRVSDALRRWLARVLAAAPRFAQVPLFPPSPSLDICSST